MKIRNAHKIPGNFNKPTLRRMARLRKGRTVGPVLGQPQWGLWDTKDECWLGNDNGPKLFPDQLLARASAQMTDVQFGRGPGRTVAALWTPQPLRLKDELHAKMTPREALQAIEEGTLI